MKGLSPMELKVLNILWRTGRGMTAVDIVEESGTLLLNTVFGALRELVKNGLVENIGNLPCKKTSSRGYRPAEGSKEYVLSEFVSAYDGFQEAISPSELCAVLLREEEDPERLASELKKMKAILDDCERELSRKG